MRELKDEQRVFWPSDNFISNLCAAESSLGYQLRLARSLTLRDYLKGLVTNLPGPNRYRDLLAAVIQDDLERRRASGSERAARQLLKFPVIQQADHSNLLLDSETFLNNYLFALACEFHHMDLMLGWQCSTVSCISKRSPMRGPVFLQTRGGMYRVLRFSNRFLKDSTFCALPGPFRVRLEPESGFTGKDTDPLLSKLRFFQGDNACDLYRCCNDYLWPVIVPGLIDRISLDEDTTSELVARHLEDPTSPIHRLLFDHNVRDVFVNWKHRMISDPYNLAVNCALPDFFWIRVDTRLKPLLLKGRGGKARFMTVPQDGEVDLDTPRQCAHLLRTGKIYADRILAYLSRCLLPGVVAIGGSSQQDYVALYQRLFLRVDDEVSFLDDAGRKNLGNMSLSRVGGALLVEQNENLREALQTLGATQDAVETLNTFLDQPLGKCIGTLRDAQYLVPRVNGALQSGQEGPMR